MAKLTALFMILVLCFSLSYAARPEPGFSRDTPLNAQHAGVEAQHNEIVYENCEGVGDEECLMRRTLAAHLDYIYTQKQKP
ncbi:hypothetical protein F0562_013061 [Nyssa sinensis]|uniref:Phytosulfokine n=1 Tax=Nyssa sinensis TaxID=561372 RepID=A0A5J4ZXY5_9ASTE|nr:hypothetical protein F0562_013061 [Nyssa sinensis]